MLATGVLQGSTDTGSSLKPGGLSGICGAAGGEGGADGNSCSCTSASRQSWVRMLVRNALNWPGQRCGSQTFLLRALYASRPVMRSGRVSRHERLEVIALILLCAFSSCA